MRVLAAVVLLACGEDPREVVDCIPNPWIEGTGNDPAEFKRCERGCLNGPASADDLAGRDEEVAACAAIGCDMSDLTIYEGEVACCAAVFVGPDDERVFKWHACE